MRTTLLKYLSAFAVASLSLATTTQALITSDPTLPPTGPGGSYLTPADVHATYGGAALTIVLSQVQHQPFAQPPPERREEPGTTNEIEDFHSSVMGMVSANGGPAVPAQGTGPVQTKVFGKIGQVTGTFDTEMLSMSLQGNSAIGAFMIRESPTRASTGRTSITDIGGGMYRIDSFFDIFTELSLDGGQTWMPSTDSVRVSLAPEPVQNSVVSTFIKGGAVPGVDGGVFKSFGIPAINASSTIAVIGKYGGSSGVPPVAFSGTGLFVGGSQLVKVGDEIPAGSGVKIKAMKDPVIDDAGNVAFPATLMGAGITPANDSALISNAPGGTLAIVAQEGDAAPGTAGVWKGFASVTAPGGGGALILGSLLPGGAITTANDTGVWSVNNGGFMSLVLREGTTMIGTKTVKSFKVLKSVSGTPGQTHAFNDQRELVSHVTFGTGEQAVVKSTLP